MDTRWRQPRSYKSRVREAACFSSVGDRSGRRVAPRAVPPRNRAHSPRPRNVHWFSRLVRKTWRPATMSRCISTRSFRTASIRLPTSSLVSVRRRQCRVSRARGILAPCVARVQNKATDVSLPRALSPSHFSGVPKCICLIRCIFKARLTQSVDRARDRVENLIVDEDNRLSAIPLCVLVRLLVPWTVLPRRRKLAPKSNGSLFRVFPASQ